MKEIEEMYLLRFRYGRTAEMFIAYKTFLHRQVNIGDKNYCHDEEVVRQVTPRSSSHPASDNLFLSPLGVAGSQYSNFQSLDEAFYRNT